MVEPRTNCCTYVLKWIRYLYRPILRLHTVYLINEPLKIVTEVLSVFSLKTFMFVLLMVLMQAVLALIVKGVRLQK